MNFLRKLFRRNKQHPDPYFEAERLPDEDPKLCPVCGSRIAIAAGGWWSCKGLRDREEVEEFLGPEFPKGRVPRELTSVEPCGWRGHDSDYKIKWL